MGDMESPPHDYPFARYGRRALAFESRLDAPTLPRQTTDEGYGGASPTFAWTEWTAWRTANLVVSAIVPPERGYVFPHVESRRLHLPIIDIDYPARVEDGVLWLGKYADEDEAEALVEAFSMLKMTDYQKCDVLDRDGETGLSLVEEPLLSYRLVPSSNPEHRHLFVEVPFTHDEFLGEGGILASLANGGLLEEGYYRASRANGCSAARLSPKPGHT